MMLSISSINLFNKNNVIQALSKIGNYSYSIYLSHFPIIVLLNYKSFMGTNIGFKNYIDLLIIVTLTSIFSYFLFNFVEKIRFYKNSFLWIFFLTFFAVGVTLIAPFINKMNYSDDQMKIFNAWFDKDISRCSKIFRILNPLSIMCKINTDVNDKQIVLIGDSHGNSIKNTFAKEMSSENLNTFYLIPKFIYSQKYTKNFLNEASKLKVKSVVFFYHMNQYSEKDKMNYMRRFIKKLKKNNINVYFILPVPIYKYHIQQTLFQKTILNETKITLINTNQYNKKIKLIKEKLMELKVDPINILSPSKYLSNKNHCLIEEKGIPLYFETNHLTLTASKKLSPMFQHLGQLINKYE